MAPVTTCHVSADTSIVLSCNDSASQTMWAAVTTCVARKLINQTRFTCSFLQLSWHRRSLSGITSTSYLEEEGKAFGSCAHASSAVAAPHDSPSDMTLVTPSSHYCNKHIFCVRVRTVKGRWQAVLWLVLFWVPADGRDSVTHKTQTGLNSQPMYNHDSSVHCSTYNNFTNTNGSFTLFFSLQ